MILNEKIRAYLLQNNISFTFEDYQTGQPEGELNQILKWNAEKLGPQPTQEQLDVAWSLYKPSSSPKPTKEELLAQLQALQTQIQALE